MWGYSRDSLIELFDSDVEEMRGGTLSWRKWVEMAEMGGNFSLFSGGGKFLCLFEEKNRGNIKCFFRK